MEMQIDFVRKWNARFLADKAGGIQRFSELVDRSQAQISHLIGRNPIKTIERRLSRALEEKSKMPAGWLDTPHPAEWLKIQDSDWRAELNREFFKLGIKVSEDTAEADSETVELLTFYALLEAKDRARLIEIARILARENPSDIK